MSYDVTLRHACRAMLSSLSFACMYLLRTTDSTDCALTGIHVLGQDAGEHVSILSRVDVRGRLSRVIFPGCGRPKFAESVEKHL